MNKFTILILTSFFSITSFAQYISGSLNNCINQSISLEGFNGLQTYLISKTTTDSDGSFKLNYSSSDYGVGYLISADNKPLFVILSGEDIELKGEALSNPVSIKILKGAENKYFEQYAAEHPKREQALSAWDYLERIYLLDSLFIQQKKPMNAIREEKNRIKKEDRTFLAQLPGESYISWFLPTRKLVSSVSVIAQYRTDEIPSTIEAFRQLNYTDPKLFKSGLFKDAIESHFWLLENSGRSIDSVFIEMKISIDSILNQLNKDEKLMNLITDFLFDLLEKQSLYEASEYLAIKALNQNTCKLNEDLSNQLETYRAMKKGNIAPDLIFTGDIVCPGYDQNEKPEKVSDLQSDYLLVVFGASWCPACQNEMPKMVGLYNKWKSNGLDILYISLDESPSDFLNFTKKYPFVSVCDYQKWNSPLAKGYYVFGTPSMFLLDSKRKILLRPSSINQMDAWVDWFLIQGNKQKE